MSSPVPFSLRAGALALLCSLAAVAGCGGESTGVGGSGTTATGGTGGSGGSPTGGGGSMTSTGGTGGSMMAVIPDPGTTVGGEWTDVEPNDTPGNAVPVGIVNGPIWMGFADPPTAISSPTDVDYFVFKTGDAAGLPNVNMQVCWSFAGNLLDMNLYDVVDSKKGPLVKSATSTDASCETLIDFGDGANVLEPDTIYLLEVAAAPGLDLAGDPGFYSA